MPLCRSCFCLVQIPFGRVHEGLKFTLTWKGASRNHESRMFTEVNKSVCFCTDHTCQCLPARRAHGSGRIVIKSVGVNSRWTLRHLSPTFAKPFRNRQRTYQ